MKLGRYGKEVNAGLIVMLFGIAGIVMAILEQYLYNNSMVINAYIQNGVTLSAVQALTIIVFMIFGGLTAAATV